MVDAKQNQIADAFPNIQQTLKMHQNLIESEQSKLHTTYGQVQELEVNHSKLLEELQKMRQNMDLNRGNWQGMIRGLQAAKKTMHMEGDGEMLPSATRLRNSLPPLSNTATSARPASSYPLPALNQTVR